MESGKQDFEDMCVDNLSPDKLDVLLRKGECVLRGSVVETTYSVSRLFL